MTLRERLIFWLLPKSRWKRLAMLEDALLPANRDELNDYAAELLGYEDFAHMTDHIERRQEWLRSSRD